MSGYGKLQNDSDNQDDPDVDQSAQTNELDDCVSYTSHDSNEESPLIGSNDGKENLKFGDYLRQRRKNRRKIDRDAFLPEQFEIKKRPVPWKAIGYAIGLFVVGTACLIAGCLIHTGHVDNEKFGDRLWPMIIFGALMFIPGSYHVYLALNAYLDTPGYSFDDIPEFD